MPSAHVFEHLPQEGLGAFRPVLEAAGWSVRVNATPIEGVDRPGAVAADLLIVMGGPCAAYEADIYPYLKDEIETLAERIAADRPTLGICLGSQLMALAMGARVYKGPAAEIGWHAIGLTEAGRASPLSALDGVPILHWHGDTFDLPERCELLAFTPAYRHQAFRRGPNILALQFHPEADGTDFEHWLVGAEQELRRHQLSVAGLRSAAARCSGAAGSAGCAMFRGWLRQVR